MEPPEKPLPTDCCGTGCTFCVYDVYVEALRTYEVWLQSQVPQPTDLPSAPPSE